MTDPWHLPPLHAHRHTDYNDPSYDAVFWSVINSIREGSVCGVRPIEAPTMKITAIKNGWSSAVYTGDGTKPGSLKAWSSFATMKEATDYAIGVVKTL